MHHRASLAVPLSFGIFIVAWVFELVVYFGFPYNSTTITAQHLSHLFSFFPWTLLSKGILDLADATTGLPTLLHTVPHLSPLRCCQPALILPLCIPFPSGSWQYGISWQHRDSYCWSGTPPPAVQQATDQYWQPGCKMPLGQIYWVLVLQV